MGKFLKDYQIPYSEEEYTSKKKNPRKFKDSDSKVEKKKAKKRFKKDFFYE